MTLGSAPKTAINANWLADPVRWNTHTPSAKLVRPVPRAETSWPNQIVANTLFLLVMRAKMNATS